MTTEIKKGDKFLLEATIVKVLDDSYYLKINGLTVVLKIGKEFLKKEEK